MSSSFSAQVHHRMASLVAEVISQRMDSEEKYSFIKTIMDWREEIASSNIKCPKYAPYSTGWSIDKVSLIVAPLVASTGVVISKVFEPLSLFGPHRKRELLSLTSCNNLSDKLQSVPGFQTSLSLKEIKDQLCKVGAVLFAIPKSMAPFFQKIFTFNKPYSFQDHHDSLVCRLMSSMLISGVIGASFDIKIGEDSTIKNSQEARKLALSLKSICERMSINTSFILSDMNQPLGHAMGSSLEAREVIEVLKGRGPLDVLKLALELGTEILLLAKNFSNRIEAKRALKKKIIKGDALEKFKEIIEAQKGNPRIIDDYSLLPLAEERAKILSPKKGFIHKIMMRHICSLCLELETWPRKSSDSINHGSGFLLLKKIGDSVEKGQILAEVYSNKVKNVSWFDKELQKAFIISEKPPDFQPFIIERI